MENNVFSYEVNDDNIINVQMKEEIKVNEKGIGSELFYTMDKFKTRIAQIDVQTGQTETYNSLYIRSVRTAIEMKNNGIQKGDIICLCSCNQLDAVVPFIASMFLGAKIASLDPTLPLDDTIHLLKQIEPKMIFFSVDAIDLIENALESCPFHTDMIIFGESKIHQSFFDYTLPKSGENRFEPVNTDRTDTAVIFFSSGTTGLPKGIEISHNSLLYHSEMIVYFGIDSSVTLGFTTLYWISAVMSVIFCILHGSVRLICRKFSPYDFWTIIETYKVTFGFNAPSQAIQILKAGRPRNITTSSMRDYLIGGAPISTESLEAIRMLFPGTAVHSGYGQTEVGGIITMFKTSLEEELKFILTKGNSAGRPVPGSCYKVVDPETCKTLGPNEQGELRIKSNRVMKGYYKLDTSNAWDEDGWLRTGDIVFYDDDLCFYIVDRIKEMLKFQSWHVTPAKIEGVLLSHPGVEQAVVIGIPDEDDGDHPMGVVVKSKNAEVTSHELIKYVEERVDDKQRLRAGILFLDKLPYTPSGKVKRKELRDMILKQLEAI